MRKIYFKINEDGKFVEPVLFDALPMITEITTDKENNKVEIQIPDPHYISKRPLNGLHDPTWNEEKQEWENGISDEEIEKKRKENKKQPLTKAEKRMQKLERQLKASGEENEFLADLIAELAMKLYD